MWEKVKKVLSVLVYPLLLVAGILMGRRFAGRGDDGRSDLERAHGELEAAERSAQSAQALVDRLERDIAELGESGRDAGRKLEAAGRRAAECTGKLKSLRDEIVRARDKGEECTELLEKHAELAGRAGELIAELQRRHGKGSEQSEKSEHTLDDSHSRKRVDSSDGTADQLRRR